MIDQVLCVYERVGTALSRLEPYLSIVALLLFVVGFPLMLLATFSSLVFFAIIWLGWAASFSWMFRARTAADGTPEPSAVRDFRPCVRTYFLAFVSVGWLFLCYFTIIWTWSVHRGLVR